MLKGGAGKEKGSSRDSSKLSESNSEKDNFNIAASVNKTKPDSGQTKGEIYKKLILNKPHAIDLVFVFF